MIDTSAASFAKAESLLRELLLTRSNPRTLSRLASVLHNRGLVCAKQQQADVALVAIQEAIELQQRALAAIPQNAHFKRLLNAHQEAFALIAKRERLLSQSKDLTLLHDGVPSSNPSSAMAR